MKTIKGYVMAGLALGLVFAASQAAEAKKDYYAILEPRVAIPSRFESTTLVETTSMNSYPVIVERTISSAVVLEPSKIPVVLDRTTTVRPPRFLEFGVWR